MNASSCRTFLHVLMLAVFVLTLDAEGEETDGKDCSTIIKVRRNTVYNASLGQELRIHCSVSFCNNSTPTVSWIKPNEPSFYVSSDSHIKTQLNMINSLEGESFLIFQTILRSDSGQYLCQSGNSVSHVITVSVYGDVELTTVTWTDSDSESGSLTTLKSFWLFVYRAIGIMAFIIIVMVIYVASVQMHKEKPRIAPDPNRQSSLEANKHIYEND
ncbi:uncharacterized protein [Brachyistius frenatus]|uniref:uncharacterized protein n=1 Tax=Brachyistius frenatus TaxID=100188 RepID=UPI0037E7D632